MKNISRKETKTKPELQEGRPQGMPGSGPPCRRVVLAIVCLALAGCGLWSGARLSPSEIEVVEDTTEQYRGEESPVDRAFAVIVNNQGQFLLSQYVRPQKTKPDAWPLTPTGGERPIFENRSNDIAFKASNSTGLEYWVIKTKVFQPLSYKGETAYGLNWTLPGAEMLGNESAWETVLRAARDKAGVRPEMLRREFVHIDRETRTAYYRLRYKGNPADQFIFEDPAKRMGGPYHAKSQWINPNEGPVMTLDLYLRLVDGLSQEAADTLFAAKPLK